MIDRAAAAPSLPVESLPKRAVTPLDRRRRFLMMMLGLITLIFYGWSFRGLAAMDDEYVMLNVTANIVDLHTFQVFTRFAVLYDLPTDANAPIMSKYGIGQSALAIPLYALGEMLPGFGTFKIGNQPIPLRPYKVALLLDTLLTIAAMYGVIFTVHLLGYHWRTAAVAGILYATATIAWPYAKTFFSEPAIACFLIGHIYWTIRFRRDQTIQAGLISGLCLGIAILVRTTSVVIVPISLLYLLPFWKRFLWPLIGITIGVILVLIYDQVRYGSPFLTGYQGEWNFRNPIGEALLGFTFSPTRGMFIFSPILLLAIPGVWWLWQRVKRETVYLIVLTVVYTLLFSMWYFWDGGGSLASRFLVPLLPIGIVLLSPVIERPHWRLGLIGLSALSVGLQILWNLSQFSPVAMQADVLDYYWTWNWDRSYLLMAWPAYYTRGNPIDSTIVQALQIADPGLRAVVFALGALILLGILIAIALRIPNAPVFSDHERTTVSHALAAR